MRKMEVPRQHAFGNMSAVRSGTRRNRSEVQSILFWFSGIISISGTLIMLVSEIALHQAVALHEFFRLDPGFDDFVVNTTNGLEYFSNLEPNPGNLEMYAYVPSYLKNPAPVVVALHGCGEAAAEYARGTGWNNLADREGFIVIYPQQNLANNSGLCFNWSGNRQNLTHQTRGDGENLSIKAMVDRIRAEFPIDSARVFVTGASTGASMAAVLLATWPDVFSAGALIGGIPYLCSDNYVTAYRCSRYGRTLEPKLWGGLVQNYGFPLEYHGPIPRVSIWHGTDDASVAPKNLTELMKQWTFVHGIDPVADTESFLDTAAGTHRHLEYLGENGEVLVETFELENLDHGVPIQVPTHRNGGEFECGSADPCYVDIGICSTLEIADFFGLN